MKVSLMFVVMLAGAAYGADYPYRAVELKSVRVTGGFHVTEARMRA